MTTAFAHDAPVYFRSGANVLPIATGSKVPPQGIRWADWQRRRQTDDEFNRLVDAHHEQDVAITLGRGSGGLVDIETDGIAGVEALRELRLPLPPTAMFESPRSVHRVYRSSVPFRSRKGIRQQLDVLAAGAYVLVPRSGPRAWLTPGFLDAVAPLPEAWVEFLSAQRPRLTGEELTTVERAGVGDLRNVTLASLVGRWLTQGFSEAQIRAKACEWARKVPQTPAFDETEAEAVVTSIIRTRKLRRSPEREAVTLARAHRLKQPAQSVFVALVALWGELGLSEPVLCAPHRLVASYARVDRDVVGPAYRTLEANGLIHVSQGRDAYGRKVTVVRLRLALAAAG